VKLACSKHSAMAGLLDRLDAGKLNHLAPLLDFCRHIDLELLGGEDGRRGGYIGERRQ
jgi:hypothetical protein